jgi:hypothetical protein
MPVDAESINRGIDDSLYLRRAHSVGHLSQRINMIGYALMVNSLTLYLLGDGRTSLGAASDHHGRLAV